MPGDTVRVTILCAEMVACRTRKRARYPRTQQVIVPLWASRKVRISALQSHACVLWALGETVRTCDEGNSTTTGLSWPDDGQQSQGGLTLANSKKTCRSTLAASVKPLKAGSQQSHLLRWRGECFFLCCAALEQLHRSPHTYTFNSQ